MPSLYRRQVDSPRQEKAGIIVIASKYYRRVLDSLSLSRIKLNKRGTFMGDNNRLKGLLETTNTILETIQMKKNGILDDIECKALIAPMVSKINLTAIEKIFSTTTLTSTTIKQKENVVIKEKPVIQKAVGIETVNKDIKETNHVFAEKVETITPKQEVKEIKEVRQTPNKAETNLEPTKSRFDLDGIFRISSIVLGMVTIILALVIVSYDMNNVVYDLVFNPILLKECLDRVPGMIVCPVITTVLLLGSTVLTIFEPKKKIFRGICSLLLIYAFGASIYYCVDISTHNVGTRNEVIQVFNILLIVFIGILTILPLIRIIIFKQNKEKKKAPKIKLILTGCLFGCLCLSAIPVTIFTVNGVPYEYSYGQKNGEISVIIEKYIGKQRDEIIIPSSVYGTPVRYITYKTDHAWGFASKITIPQSVHYIGASSFHYLSNLRVINLSQNTNYIGHYAFFECYNLQYIIIPSSVTYIGKYAFYGCTNIEIYCEAESQPSNWDPEWCEEGTPVYWGGEWS